MSASLGGKSALTGNGTLLIYYLCGLMTFVFIFPIFIAAIGALVSRSAAYKEGAPFVVQHCTWIFRSIWVFTLLLGVTFLGGIIFLGSEIPTIPDTSHIKEFAQLWDDPALREALQYTLGYVFVFASVSVWFLYRMLSGAFKLLCSTPIQKF